MTIQSMTGYGDAEVSFAGWTMSIQCRSVNFRGLDVRVWAPREWPWIEPFAQETAKQLLHRGRVEVRVECTERPDGVASRVNAEAFAAVAEELTMHASRAGIAPPTVADVLRFDEVVGANVKHIPEDDAPFREAITQALSALRGARAEEGARLATAVHALLDVVADAVTAVSQNMTAVSDAYRTRLVQRLDDVVGRFGLGEIDERALLQEVVLYTDRSDVSEELQRAKSHVDKLREVVANPDEEAVGKQIDFYLQELFREANTTGSKSGSLEVTEQVLRMKTAIEQLREQAANIE